jgi:hypothetical protein
VLGILIEDKLMTLRTGSHRKDKNVNMFSYCKRYQNGSDFFSI